MHSFGRGTTCAMSQIRARRLQRLFRWLSQKPKAGRQEHCDLLTQRNQALGDSGDFEFHVQWRGLHIAGRAVESR